MADMIFHASGVTEMTERPKRVPGPKHFALAQMAAKRPGVAMLDGEVGDLVTKLAEVCAIMGTRRFRLFHGLREPETALDRFELSIRREALTDHERRERYKAFVTRPLDRDMIEDFFRWRERGIRRYAKLVDAVAAHPAQQAPISVTLRAVRAISRMASQLTCMELHTEEVTQVVEFVREVAVLDDGSRCREWRAESASDLAQNVLLGTPEMWNRCVLNATGRFPPFTEPSAAFGVFLKTWGYSETVPRPGDLMTLVRLERRKVLKAFATQQAAVNAPPTAASVSIHPTTVTVTAGVVHIAGGATSEAGGAGPQRDGKPWQVVQTEAERIVIEAGGEFPGLKLLQTRCGCSRPTIVKAVKNSAYLRRCQAESKLARKPKEVSLTDAAMDSASQSAARDAELDSLIKDGNRQTEQEDRQHRKARRKRR